MAAARKSITLSSGWLRYQEAEFGLDDDGETPCTRPGRKGRMRLCEVGAYEAGNAPGTVVLYATRMLGDLENGGGTLTVEAMGTIAELDAIFDRENLQEMASRSAPDVG